MRRPLLRAAAAAAGTFLCGFGAMAAWWRWTPAEEGVRGFHDYRAATLGDGVLLPLFVWTLVRTHDRLEPSPHDRAAAWVGGLAGAALGLSVVAAAWVDPVGEANWTSPRPGEFTAAGWYHNAFVVAASAASTALYGRVLARVHRGPRAPGVVGGLVGLGVLGAGFAALVSLDNAGSFNPLSHGMTAAVLVTGLVSVAVPIAWLLRPDAPTRIGTGPEGPR